MPALPLIYNITQIFDGTIFYPGHKFPIKSKVWTTFISHKATNILRMFIIIIDEGVTC